jgi:anti-sigma regulatory factor (Ser/Thr protein kinase)
MDIPARFAALFNAIALPVCIARADGTIVYANQLFCRETRISRKMISIGVSWHDHLYLRARHAAGDCRTRTTPDSSRQSSPIKKKARAFDGRIVLLARVMKSAGSLRAIILDHPHRPKTAQCPVGGDIPIREELEMARHVQEGLLPKDFPTATNVEPWATYIPTGEVGGDLYDVIITPGGKTAILIFDVSGHGVPAALIGTMAKMLFAQYLAIHESPAKIFDCVNSHLCRLITTDHYLTAFLGLYNPRTGILTYAHAAHVPPLLYRSQSQTAHFLEGDQGSLIGHASLRDIAHFHDMAIRLAWNDSLLLYTDGLTDAMNRAGELYGAQRLHAIVTRYGNLRVTAFIQKILNDLYAFCRQAPLRDDVTMLAVRIGCDPGILAESGFTREDAPFMLIVRTLPEIETICSQILEEMALFGYPESALWKAKFCICEVLYNAVVHGNKNERHKKVTVLYTVTMEFFAVSVIDEGDGFDHHHLPDPLLNENLSREHGRGLFIVRKLMDQVIFNEKGNRIQVVTFRSGDEQC